MFSHITISVSAQERNLKFSSDKFWSFMTKFFSPVALVFTALCYVNGGLLRVAFLINQNCNIIKFACVSSAENLIIEE